MQAFLYGAGITALYIIFAVGIMLPARPLLIISDGHMFPSTQMEVVSKINNMMAYSDTTTNKSIANQSSM